MSKKQVVILGGGTGGTMVANRLRNASARTKLEIHVVDRDDRHVYQPGLLFVPSGSPQLEKIVRPRRRQLRDGIVFHEGEVESVSLEHDEVALAGGTTLPYDVLVVASGVRLQPEETEGLTARAGTSATSPSTSPRGATALADAFARFDGGRLVVEHRRHADQVPGSADRVRLPRRLVAAQRGIRERERDRPRDPARRLLHQADRLRASDASAAPRRGSSSRPSSAPARSTASAARLVSYDGREIPFDLLVAVPLHGGAAFVERSAGPRRRAGVRPHRPAHTAVEGEAEHLCPRRRDRHADLEGRLGRALRGRAAEQNIERFFARRPARGGVRRPRELLRRDGLPQGTADRLQLRDRATAGPVPDGLRPAAASARVASQPPRQARVPVGLLARAPARPRDPRHRARDADRRQEADPRPRRERSTR